MDPLNAANSADLMKESNPEISCHSVYGASTSLSCDVLEQIYLEEGIYHADHFHPRLWPQDLMQYIETPIWEV